MSVLVEFLGPPSSYPLGKFLGDYPAVSVDVDRIVPTGGSTHYVWLSGEAHGALAEELREDHSIEEVCVVDELPGRVLIRFERERSESPLFRLAAEFQATPVGVHGTEEGWRVRLRFSDQETLTTFYETCRREGVHLELRQTYRPNGFPREAEFGLTATQAETLDRALEAGYFEIPRRTTLAELATDLGVSEQAVSERLRRGLSSLLVTEMRDDEPEETR